MKIIYIIGAGRSGTTLLDIILGNQSELFSAGELNRYTKRKGLPHDPRNEDIKDFWDNVKYKLEEKGSVSYDDIEEMQYHSAFFKRNIIKKNFPKFEKFNKSLFSTISEFIPNEKNSIIDSSKYPMRALLLSKIFKQNIMYVYMQKSPETVVKSFQKKSIEQPSKGYFSAHLYLLGVNILALIVLKKLRKNHKISIVNYDNLCNNTMETLTNLENDLDLNLDNLKLKISDSIPLSVGYLFDGNRLRLKDEILIQSTKTGEPNLSFLDKLFLKVHKLIWYKV